MKLSIVIPAYNEEESISETIDQIEEAFSKVSIDHEILVVNDNSKDNTAQVLEELSKKYSEIDTAITAKIKRASIKAAANIACPH